MISLLPRQEDLLRSIINAGREGVWVDGNSLGDLLALALDGLVDVTGDRRAVATAKGRAFALRGVA